MGKTTTAVNLASLAAIAGKKCLLLDLDPQANATSNLGIARDKNRNLGANLIGGCPIEEILTGTPIDGLDLLPGHASLTRVEQELAGMPDPLSPLRHLIKGVEAKYEIIIIDCPPSMGLLPRNALSCAESVLVPIQCEYFAMEGLSQMMSTIEAVRKTNNPALELEGILFTMYEEGVQHCDEIVEEIRKHFDRKTYRTIVPRDITVAEAASFGLPLVLYQPRSRAARSYVELTKEIISADK